MKKIIIQVYRDGNQVCALIGDDIQSGTVGWGDTIALALIDLSKQIEIIESLP